MTAFCRLPLLYGFSTGVAPQFPNWKRNDCAGEALKATISPSWIPMSISSFPTETAWAYTGHMGNPQLVFLIGNQPTSQATRVNLCKRGRDLSVDRVEKYSNNIPPKNAIEWMNGSGVERPTKTCWKKCFRSETEKILKLYAQIMWNVEISGKQSEIWTPVNSQESAAAHFCGCAAAQGKRWQLAQGSSPKAHEGRIAMEWRNKNELLYVFMYESIHICMYISDSLLWKSGTWGLTTASTPVCETMEVGVKKGEAGK